MIFKGDSMTVVFVGSCGMSYRSASAYHRRQVSHFKQASLTPKPNIFRSLSLLPPTLVHSYPLFHSNPPSSGPHIPPPLFMVDRTATFRHPDRTPRPRAWSSRSTTHPSTGSSTPCRSRGSSSAPSPAACQGSSEPTLFRWAPPFTWFPIEVH